MNLKFNKKRTISLLVVFTMLLPMLAQALGLGMMQLKVTDEESGVNEVLLPDGTTTSDTDIEYSITKNGFYKFTAYDNAGNMAQEFVIAVSDINENTELGEIENIIDEVDEELPSILDGNQKDKLKEELNNLKESYDGEVKSRIDKIDESIDNMISIDESEIIEHEINKLPSKYQSDKYKPTLEAEKDRLNQKLQDKINEISNKNELEIATEAVKKAEKTLNQEDVDSAREKVKNLNNEEQKNKLNERLDKVQELINKIKKVEKDIENMEDLEEKNHIQNEINELPDGKEKDRLQQALDDKVEELEAINNGNKTLSEAIEAVKKAERTLQQIDLDRAWVKVKLLAEGKDRDELSDRLNIVQELIFAIKQIEKDIDNMKSLEDEYWIQREIDRLPSGSERNRLQQKLDNKIRELEGLENDDKALQQAIEAVERAERTITQRDVDRAWVLVNRLPSSRSKDNLIRRLDRVQDLIDERKIEEEDLEEAIKAVERAEVTLQQRNLDTARKIVNKLPASIIKDSLNKRLDLVQKLIDGEKEKENKGNKDKEDEKLLEEVSDAVKKAEVTMKDEDIENAKNKINQLPDGIRKDIFKERLELIEKIKALKAETEKPKTEKPKPDKPPTQEPKPEKPTANPSTPPSTSRPSTTKTLTNPNPNNDYSYNTGFSDDDGSENEENIADNLYYKKPVREKQTKFFKLKEPKLPEKNDYDGDEYDDYTEIEENTEEIPEVIEKAKPKKSKLPIIIVLLLIVGAGVGITIFIRTKNKEKEDSYD